MEKYSQVLAPYGPYREVPRETADAAFELLTQAGLPVLGNQHTEGTPYRLAHYLRYWARPKAEPRFTVFENKDPVIDQMVVVSPIPFWACCSHHMLPFFGTVHFGYIPTSKLVGLSMVPLLVKEFCARPWLQETMTSELADLFERKLSPLGLGLITEATHTCQMLDLGGPPVPQMVFSEMRGAFFEFPTTRAEFLRLVERSK